ncbi:hypothetical chaperone protein [Ferrimonas sediminum]|uniref:Hypothetical chaperone protein n=1 Tax=Ferrimonas sediminum TaxID=718193 RepID=A0A1G9B5T4_9GAMM|nr:molecular chaperone [Ferrimonas sediminum]SDK34464.1 hypothetical chaperone protein [Ferrimonas sediminum]
MTHSSIAGFDFGTSNCAIGVMADAAVQLVELPAHGRYMSSTLFAPQREMMTAWLFKQLQQQQLHQPFQQARRGQLPASTRAMNELKLDGYGDSLEFGTSALAHYLEDPADCYYVKSPKSFLGASGLLPPQQQQFEDVVAAMMWHLLCQLDQAGQSRPDKVVIGRPINFQGLNSDDSNRQALQILQNAARFVGFKQVEFLYEPMAAGLAYQQQLAEEQKVLVVDIGGGTSDISLVTMGPDYLQQRNHQDLVLGYAGVRVGGNDFDIALNFQSLMPHLGSRLIQPSGKPVPIKPYWDAAAINDLSSQTRFYDTDTRRLLDSLRREPELAEVGRLLTLANERQTYQLSAYAEQAKIALSDQADTQVDLGFLEAGLLARVDQAQFETSAEKALDTIGRLADDAIAQAGCQPDVIFMTGGTSNSPLVQGFFRQRYGLPLVAGDNFGSVTTGLTLWANHIYC